MHPYKDWNSPFQSVSVSWAQKVVFMGMLSSVDNINHVGKFRYHAILNR